MLALAITLWPIFWFYPVWKKLFGMCVKPDSHLSSPVKIWIGFLVFLMAIPGSVPYNVVWFLLLLQVFLFCIVPSLCVYFCTCKCFKCCYGTTDSAKKNEKTARKKLNWIKTGESAFDED